MTKTLSVMYVLWTDRKRLWKLLKHKIKELQPLILATLLVFLAFIIVARVYQFREMEKDYAFREAANEMRLDAEKQEALRAQMEAENQKAVQNDAEAIARVLSGVSYYALTDNAKKAYIDVIFNRVDCSYGSFGDSVIDVCSKEGQWEGYREDRPYLESDYNLAITKLNGNRMMRSITSDCYWVVCNYDGSVTVRNNFDTNSATVTINIR